MVTRPTGERPGPARRLANQPGLPSSAADGQGDKHLRREPRRNSVLIGQARWSRRSYAEAACVEDGAVPTTAMAAPGTPPAFIDLNSRVELSEAVGAAAGHRQEECGSDSLNVRQRRR
jgi:hypothetical protein